MDSTSIKFRSHTALLLAVALPYLQPAYQHPVELATKFLELSETMKCYPQIPADSLHRKTSFPAESGIFAIVSRFIQDPEGLLRCLLEVCTGKEKEIVSLLLNLMQAKNFYENYGDILNTFMSADDFVNPFTSSPSQTPEKTSEDFSTADPASVLAGADLSSMLSKEQNDTLTLLKNLLNAE